MKDSLLRIENLKVEFEETGEVVDNVSFEVTEGEILGIVGESGSGKSMTALAILGLLKNKAKITNGAIWFEGQNLLELSQDEFLRLKGKEIAMIFQEPMTSLNPLMKIGDQMNEIVLLHEKVDKKKVMEMTLDALKEAGFDDPKRVFESYPHQLSGGMRQRAMITMAMMNRPKLLIADEPTTALDVTIQAKILQLILKLNQKYHTAVIFVSHDLGVVKQICNRAVVMCEGRVVEQGDVNELFLHPKEEYTKQLINAIPKRKSHAKVKVETDTVLKVNGLSVSYDDSDLIQNCLKRKKKEKEVLKDVSFSLKKGEILGIVGESGCGKTTLVKSILGMTKIKSGAIESFGYQMQMVFQDPYSSLNPSKKIGWLIEEPLKNKMKLSKKARQERVSEMLSMVGLSDEYRLRKPTDLSGGQRQRIAIAMALITNPKIIILDEPVSALDVTVQAQILELLEQLRDKYQLSYIFISHDLNVIAEICDRALVMYQGNIVEEGTIDKIFDTPSHEYTKQLLENRY